MVWSNSHVALGDSDDVTPSTYQLTCCSSRHTRVSTKRNNDRGTTLCSLNGDSAVFTGYLPSIGLVVTQFDVMSCFMLQYITWLFRSKDKLQETDIGNRIYSEFYYC